MSDILNQFRDEELPVSTVDVSGAVRAGRRRRARTWLTTIGVAVAVAAAGVTAPLWLNRPASAPPAAPTCDAGEHFDPLASAIDTGSVTGYRLTTTTTSTYWQIAGLTDPVDNHEIQVIVYGCGGQPYSPDEAGPIDPTAGEPADPVNGQPAYWLPPDQLGLAWQWTSGAWAIVVPTAEDSSADGLDELRARAHRVAAQVRFATWPAWTPVTAPVTLPAPDGTYATVVVRQFAYDNGRRYPVGYSIAFDRLGADPPTHYTRYTPYLEIGANPFTGVDDLPRSASPYPEDLGYPAYSVVREDLGGTKILLVLDFFTFSVEIVPWHVPGTPEEKLAVAADVFRTITAYPDSASDLSAWGAPLA